MRKPVFLIALVVIGLTVLVELSSIALIGNVVPAANSLGVSINGQAVPSMSILDGLIFYAMLVMAIALILPERFQSKIQGIVTIIVGLLLLISCIVRIFIDLQLLFLMLGLLLAVPFGTIAYLIVWGHFDTGSARIALSLIMFLKIVFCVCLVVAQQRFLKNKGLVLIILTSFLANLLIAFLYGLVPGFLVSILDMVAAIVVCILAAIWIIIYMIGGIISTITAFI
ncbi:MAG TPA: hypothetical protein VGL22_03520 [Terracidiphilus sp.]